MDHPMYLIAMVLLLAAVMSVVLLAGLIRQRRTLQSGPVFIGLTSCLCCLLIGAPVLFFAERSPASPPVPGTISITSGGGSGGCVVNVAGTVDLPEGSDAWLILTNERGDFYAQGGRPVAEGEMHGSWSFPAARIANSFFENAHYTWLAVIVPASTSDRLRRVVGAPGNDNGHLTADRMPSDDEISGQAVAGRALTVDVGCGR